MEGNAVVLEGHSAWIEAMPMSLEGIRARIGGDEWPGILAYGLIMYERLRQREESGELNLLGKRGPVLIMGTGNGGLRGLREDEIRMVLAALDQQSRELWNFTI